MRRRKVRTDEEEEGAKHIGGMRRPWAHIEAAVAVVVRGCGKELNWPTNRANKGEVGVFMGRIEGSLERDAWRRSRLASIACSRYDMPGGRACEIERDGLTTRSTSRI